MKFETLEDAIGWLIRAGITFTADPTKLPAAYTFTMATRTITARPRKPLEPPFIHLPELTTLQVINKFAAPFFVHQKEETANLDDYMDVTPLDFDGICPDCATPLHVYKYKHSNTEPEMYVCPHCLYNEKQPRVHDPKEDREGIDDA